MADVAGIILAAGRGTRFGPEPKLLALLDRKPLVRHVAEAALDSGVHPVLVVTGHRAAEIEAALSGLPLTFVHNAAYAKGLSTSLKCGFSALADGTAAAVVLLGDMPFVGPDLIDRLVQRWRLDRPAALVPVLDGKRGNPVVLSIALRGEIRALAGDVGAGPFLRTRAGVLEEPVQDPGVLRDVDTRRELASWRVS